MKRIVKTDNSQVVSDNIQYVPGNAINNRKLKEILLQEQLNFCAYTEFRTDDEEYDVEHFNPTIKNKDDYYNWYAVLHSVNNHKSEKWVQPVLEPTSEDLEERIWYSNGYYKFNADDLHAYNLVEELIDLNNERWVKRRSEYINRMKLISNKFNLFEYFQGHPSEVQFRRALETELNIVINQHA
jgi:hypothetical protein